jgi:SpoVK/Ycf46/Vps4 family AAA+-type ATPase
MEIEKGIKKTSANDTIISMLSNINADKKDLFYKSVERYAETLALSNNSRYTMLSLLKSKPMRFNQLSSLSPDLKKLIQQSEVTEDNVFLNEDIKTLIDELLLEWKNKEIYKYHNLPVRNKILLHGSTGNGKTTIARHIAKLSNLPFVEINSGSVIERSIGSSGQNIFKIFNEIAEPCVLFWDEVDSIGKRRGIDGTSAGTENERMVNSILVNIEKLSNDVIFIGATNRKEVLDSAFLRRFDVQFELTAPDEELKAMFFKQMIDYYKLPESYINKDISILNSYSEIKMMLLDLARKYVISNLKITNDEPVNSLIKNGTETHN